VGGTREAHIEFCQPTWTVLLLCPAAASSGPAALRAAHAAGPVLPLLTQLPPAGPWPAVHTCPAAACADAAAQTTVPAGLTPRGYAGQRLLLPAGQSAQTDTRHFMAAAPLQLACCCSDATIASACCMSVRCIQHTAYNPCEQGPSRAGLPVGQHPAAVWRLCTLPLSELPVPAAWLQLLRQRWPCCGHCWLPLQACAAGQQGLPVQVTWHGKASYMRCEATWLAVRPTGQ
jgi:hypothetical protein